MCCSLLQVPVADIYARMWCFLFCNEGFAKSTVLTLQLRGFCGLVALINRVVVPCT